MPPNKPINLDAWDYQPEQRVCRICKRTFRQWYALDYDLVERPIGGCDLCCGAPSCEAKCTNHDGRRRR